VVRFANDHEARMERLRSMMEAAGAKV